jgi:hypothetical protein
MHLLDFMAVVQQGMRVKVHTTIDWSTNEKVKMVFEGIFTEIKHELTQTSFSF